LGGEGSKKGQGKRPNGQLYSGGYNWRAKGNWKFQVGEKPGEKRKKLGQHPQESSLSKEGWLPPEASKGRRKGGERPESGGPG